MAKKKAKLTTRYTILKDERPRMAAGEDITDCLLAYMIEGPELLEVLEELAKVGVLDVKLELVPNKEYVTYNRRLDRCTVRSKKRRPAM